MATPLDQLRANPEAAINDHDFYLDVRGFQTTEIAARSQLGGAVTISAAAKREEGVTRLTLTAGGTDYYFPWVNRGVGEVVVPINAPNGTIVITGGMNGCALQVNRTVTDLIFYHDADCRYLGQLRQPAGNLLCRIEPSLYQVLPIGENLMLDVGGGSVYTHQMICVRRGDAWKVVYCGVLLGPGINMPIRQGFQPGVSKYLASFNE